MEKQSDSTTFSFTQGWWGMGDSMSSKNFYSVDVISKNVDAYLKINYLIF